MSRIASPEMSIAAREERRRSSARRSPVSIMRLSSAASAAISRGPVSGTRASPWRAGCSHARRPSICSIGRTSQATDTITAMKAMPKMTASRKSGLGTRSRTGPNTRLADRSSAHTSRCRRPA